MRTGLVFLLCVVLANCAMTPDVEEKINGVSFVASRDSIQYHHIEPLLDIHANYAAIMPFGFIRDLENPELHYNSNRQWFGETVSGSRQYIEELQAQNIGIMLKPQIWIGRGEFTGLVKMESEEDWQKLETSYSNFILDYALLAEETNVEMFCIGTELEQFVQNRPDYWKNLIEKIKKIYNGKLTYAANWDEYSRVLFWDQLDYIGIDAYFPLSEERTPSIAECERGWDKYKSDIKKLSSETGKPILFTEYGYRSVDYAAREPWQASRDMTGINMEAQTNATQALYNQFWDEPWFAGGFIWKWFHRHQESGGEENNQFTPQNKPVEKVIKETYRKL